MFSKLIDRIFSRIARVLARPAVVDWLIARAMKTPYTHITGPDGTVYMERYWLFNPYPADSSGKREWWRFPISIRLHRIMRKDSDRHLHDHPWNARTFILRGWYVERRRASKYDDVGVRMETRHAGETAKLGFGEFHKITYVGGTCFGEGDGVWTLFITGKYRGTWGFLVDGAKVPWKKYLGIE